VITMLANDDAVENVTFGQSGIIANLAKGAVHISSSTISVALSDTLAKAHARSGERFVAAPVLRRPDVAEAGQLFVVAAGPPDALTAAQPLFDAVGQHTFVVSETQKAANPVKLSGNFLIASVIESLGEAMALIDKAHVDRHKYLDILISTLFGAPVYNLWRAHCGQEVRTRWFRSSTRLQGYSPRAGRRRRPERPAADGLPHTRPLSRFTSSRRR
jgi:3-hydroxyisobutyrate dehydrogenase-like beta-hydroxyacid dehydrogenase